VSTGFGPGFQDARSRLYRVEYAAIGIAIVAYLLWRSIYIGGINWLQVVFWFLFPDLVVFIPIGLSSKRREWPSWGTDLYNLFHTTLVSVAAFAGLWVLLGVAYWPLFGWLGHIAIDRTVGYGLRARPST
jgi:hypothetical protein